MPRLTTKDDVMRTAVNLGRADQVWSAFCDSSSYPPLGCSFLVAVHTSCFFWLFWHECGSASHQAEFVKL